MLSLLINIYKEFWLGKMIISQLNKLLSLRILTYHGIGSSGMNSQELVAVLSTRFSTGLVLGWLLSSFKQINMYRNSSKTTSRLQKSIILTYSKFTSSQQKTLMTRSRNKLNVKYLWNCPQSVICRQPVITISISSCTFLRKF